MKAAEYWKTKIASAGSNSRSVWTSLNTLLGERRTDSAHAFSAEDYHDCIDGKMADIPASMASANPPTIRSKIIRSKIIRHKIIRFKISDTNSWGDYTISQLELAAVNKMKVTSSRTPQKFRLNWVEFEAVRRHTFRCRSCT